MTKAAAYGVAGLVLAGAVVFSGSALGFFSFSPSGALTVLLTDPPSVPDGVSAVYLSYSNIAVHAAGFGDSGWVTVSGSGTIDTMQLVNLSQTISTGSIPSLTYNLLAFNISGVKVDYQGQNYSATISSQRLTVPIVGGLKVNSTGTSAALVDIHPTVLNLGSQSVPQFTISAGAKAVQVPPGDVNDSMKQVGNRFPLEGRGWFLSFSNNHASGLTISGVALSAGSLSLGASNSGADPIGIRMIIITPELLGNHAASALGAVTSGAVFSVGSDGKLTLVAGNAGQVASALGSDGFSLAGGANQQFTYSGTITTVLGGQGIVKGEGYYVVVIGSGTPSVQTVTAT